MGGYRSGRPGQRRRVEHFRSLDVFKMKRQGCLEPGRSGSWAWFQDGEELARIDYSCSGRALSLKYHVREGGGDWELVEHSAPLSQAPCNFGGERTYVTCPGIANGRQCSRRVRKLYAAGKYFLCRHCYELAYASQSEERHDRHMRRSNKLRMGLGGEAGAASCIAPKPKGMWWRTYWRIIEEIEHREATANHLFIQRVQKLLSPEDQKYIS